MADAEAADRAVLVGTVLTAALQLGLALRGTELATEYAKEREQFGRVIGSFQAVKHLCADMLVRAEVARAAVYAAAVTLDGRSDEDPARAAAVAKVMAGDAALANGKSGIQVHGGIGFTWEVDAQRFWKRAVGARHPLRQQRRARRRRSRHCSDHNGGSCERWASVMGGW